MDTLEDSARFLMQATLGADYATIQRVSNEDIAHWLDGQLNSAHASSDTFQSKTEDIWQQFRSQLIEHHGDQLPKVGDATLPYPTGIISGSPGGKEPWTKDEK